MPRLASNFLVSELVRTFGYRSDTSVPVTLDITLAYTTAEKIEDEQQKQTRRVIGNRRFSEFEDLDAKTRAIDRMYALVLASTVRKIEGMTLRKLDALIGLENPAGDLDAPIPLDPSDTTPLSEDELAACAKDAELRDVKTQGDLAKINTIDIIAKCPKLRSWLIAVVSDVSYFTSGNEDRRKN